MELVLRIRNGYKGRIRIMDEQPGSQFLEFRIFFYINT